MLPLRVNFYPYSSHLLQNVLKPICSEHGGITRSLLATPMRYAEETSIRTVVTQMPAYHKVLLGPHADINYHLSGYGSFFEEALIRLVGEAIERYSLLVAPFAFSERICYASYDDVARSGTVVPIEYLRLYTDEDYRKLNEGIYRGLRRPEPSDIIGWVRCPSLLEPSTHIWVPAQMLFVGYQANQKEREVAFCPGFSTGTAAHTDLVTALQNALLEAVEIDALMLRWYTNRPARAVVVDDLSIPALVPDLFKRNSRYEVLTLDIRVLEEVHAQVIASIVIGKQEARPYITLGAQAGLEPVHTLYRSSHGSACHFASRHLRAVVSAQTVPGVRVGFHGSGRQCCVFRFPGECRGEATGDRKAGRRARPTLGYEELQLGRRASGYEGLDPAIIVGQQVRSEPRYNAARNSKPRVESDAGFLAGTRDDVRARSALWLSSATEPVRGYSQSIPAPSALKSLSLRRWPGRRDLAIRSMPPGMAVRS